VSVERFRKYHERIVLEQVAEEILKLCVTQDHGDRPVDVPAEVARQIRLTGRLDDTSFPIIVHTEPIELLSGIDILVIPENVYFEPPQPFKSSISAAVRRAAAVRGQDGEILTDVVSDELRSWLREHGRVGLPVAPGTVAVTSPGQMAGQGIRNIYHTAVAVPRPGTNSYDIEPTTIATSVRDVLGIARAARMLSNPPLSSLGFPLIGAGRGGLDPATSFTWLRASLERDIRVHHPWMYISSRIRDRWPSSLSRCSAKPV
jgi:O-acetyl-ADP-ribose deacetylase (regulator of RNase III)